MQHQVHFMLDYKRGQCMPVDHAHLVLWKWLWIIWLESGAVEGELSGSICPESKCDMSVLSCSLKIVHVCSPYIDSCVCVCVFIRETWRGFERADWIFKRSSH